MSYFTYFFILFYFSHTKNNQFLCEENSEDYLERVDESETCVYTVTIKTSKICRHPFLKAPARRKPVAITCNPLLTQDQWDDWMEEKEGKL